MSASQCSYERVQAICKSLLDRTKIRPSIGIICGSGLGSIADRIKDQQIIHYNSIDGFPQSTVVGHAGCFVFGKIGDVQVMCMKGRFHMYEGKDVQTCVLPVRVMHGMGARSLIVTNAAGGVNRSFKAGDIMIIRDHISVPGLAGFNPLIGLNEDRWGPRFVSLTDAYSSRYRDMARRLAKELKIDIQEGVYCMVSGPCYETPAELSAFLTLGSSAVGMSTAHEVMAAKHMGMNVLGFSLITNKCVLLGEEKENKGPSHEEVVQVANEAGAKLVNLVEKCVLAWDKK